MGEGTLRGPLLSRISTVVVMNISWIYEVHGDPVRGKNARSYIKKEATVLYALRPLIFFRPCTTSFIMPENTWLQRSHSRPVSPLGCLTLCLRIIRQGQ